MVVLFFYGLTLSAREGWGHHHHWGRGALPLFPWAATTVRESGRSLERTGVREFSAHRENKARTGSLRYSHSLNFYSKLELYESNEKR